MRIARVATLSAPCRLKAWTFSSAVAEMLSRVTRAGSRYSTCSRMSVASTIGLPVMSRFFSIGSPFR